LTRRGRLTFLGTGTSHGVPMIGCACAVCRSADPRDNRLRPSIHVAVEGGPRLLVDTGTDLRQQALRHGLAVVDAILFTHSHADHIMGLDEVRRFNAVKGGPIPLYADPFTCDELRRTFAYAFGPPPAKGGGVPQIHLEPIAGPFVVDTQLITPVPLLHGDRSILGFRLGRFAYLTDCNAIPEPSFALLEGLDVLVLDALRHRRHPTHFSVGEAIEVAARIGAGRTYFTHIAHDLGHAATCAALPAGVELAYDGLALDIDVGAPVATAQA
jgi:phosphoribosyl 1,2-cyclic phosphate phosphodiesterase